mmetsp:Transcript_26009/g.77134  ORF Transcript_26009/g.77134 Transcript_26009/m.77134 type:complete len:319 (+) Transcript_26009:64-1020(+)
MTRVSAKDIREDSGGHTYRRETIHHPCNSSCGKVSIVARRVHASVLDASSTRQRTFKTRCHAEQPPARMHHLADLPAYLAPVHSIHEMERTRCSEWQCLRPPLTGKHSMALMHWHDSRARIRECKGPHKRSSHKPRNSSLCGGGKGVSVGLSWQEGRAGGLHAASSGSCVSSSLSGGVSSRHPPPRDASTLVRFAASRALALGRSSAPAAATPTMLPRRRAAPEATAVRTPTSACRASVQYTGTGRNNPSGPGRSQRSVSWPLGGAAAPVRRTRSTSTKNLRPRSTPSSASGGPITTSAAKTFSASGGSTSGAYAAAA